MDSGVSSNTETGNSEFLDLIFPSVYDCASPVIEIVDENVDENVGQNDDENVEENVEETVKENVKENIENNVEKGVEKNVEENVEKNVEEIVQKNVEEIVQKNVEEIVQKNVEEIIEKNVEEIIEKNVEENIRNKRTSELWYDYDEVWYPLDQTKGAKKDENRSGNNNLANKDIDGGSDAEPSSSQLESKSEIDICTKDSKVVDKNDVSPGEPVLSKAARKLYPNDDELLFQEIFDISINSDFFSDECQDLNTEDVEKSHDSSPRSASSSKHGEIHSSFGIRKSQLCGGLRSLRKRQSKKQIWNEALINYYEEYQKSGPITRQQLKMSNINLASLVEPPSSQETNRARHERSDNNKDSENIDELKINTPENIQPHLIAMNPLDPENPEVKEINSIESLPEQTIPPTIASKSIESDNKALETLEVHISCANLSLNDIPQLATHHHAKDDHKELYPIEQPEEVNSAEKLPVIDTDSIQLENIEPIVNIADISNEITSDQRKPEEFEHTGLVQNANNPNHLQPSNNSTIYWKKVLARNAEEKNGTSVSSNNLNICVEKGDSSCENHLYACEEKNPNSVNKNHLDICEVKEANPISKYNQDNNQKRFRKCLEDVINMLNKNSQSARNENNSGLKDGENLPFYYRDFTIMKLDPSKATPTYNSKSVEPKIKRSEEQQVKKVLTGKQAAEDWRVNFMSLTEEKRTEPAPPLKQGPPRRLVRPPQKIKDLINETSRKNSHAITLAGSTRMNHSESQGLVVTNSINTRNRAEDITGERGIEFGSQGTFTKSLKNLENGFPCFNPGENGMSIRTRRDPVHQINTPHSPSSSIAMVAPYMFSGHLQTIPLPPPLPMQYTSFPNINIFSQKFVGFLPDQKLFPYVPFINPLLIGKNLNGYSGTYQTEISLNINRTTPYDTLSNNINQSLSNGLRNGHVPIRPPLQSPRERDYSGSHLQQSNPTNLYCGIPTYVPPYFNGPSLSNNLHPENRMTSEETPYIRYGLLALAERERFLTATQINQQDTTKFLSTGTGYASQGHANHFCSKQSGGACYIQPNLVSNPDVPKICTSNKLPFKPMSNKLAKRTGLVSSNILPNSVAATVKGQQDKSNNQTIKTVPIEKLRNNYNPEINLKTAINETSLVVDLSLPKTQECFVNNKSITNMGLSDPKSSSHTNNLVENASFLPPVGVEKKPIQRQTSVIVNPLKTMVEQEVAQSPVWHENQCIKDFHNIANKEIFESSNVTKGPGNVNQRKMQYRRSNSLSRRKNSYKNLVRPLQALELPDSNLTANKNSHNKSKVLGKIEISQIGQKMQPIYDDNMSIVPKSVIQGIEGISLSSRTDCYAVSRISNQINSFQPTIAKIPATAHSIEQSHLTPAALNENNHPVDLSISKPLCSFETIAYKKTGEEQIITDQIKTLSVSHKDQFSYTKSPIDISATGKSSNVISEGNSECYDSSQVDEINTYYTSTQENTAEAIDESANICETVDKNHIFIDTAINSSKYNTGQDLDQDINKPIVLGEAPINNCKDNHNQAISTIMTVSKDSEIAEESLINVESQLDTVKIHNTDICCEKFASDTEKHYSTDCQENLAYKNMCSLHETDQETAVDVNMLHVRKNVIVEPRRNDDREVKISDTQIEPERDQICCFEETKVNVENTENFIQKITNSESLENAQMEICREEANTECFQVESSNSNIDVLGEAQLADTQSEPKRDETLICLEEVKAGLKSIEDGDLSISPDENKEELDANVTENFIQENLISESLENLQIEVIREEANTECFQVESSNSNIGILGEAQLADTQSEPNRDETLICLEEVKAGFKNIEDGDLSISPDENKEELDANVTENFIQESINSESLENPQIEVIREEGNTECFQVESSNSNIDVLGEAQLADTQSGPKRDETLICLEEVKAGLKSIEDGDLSISPDENKEELDANVTENFIQENLISESLENLQIEVIREEANTECFQVESSNSNIGILGEAQLADTQSEPNRDETLICLEEVKAGLKNIEDGDVSISPDENKEELDANVTENFIQESINSESLENPQIEVIREEGNTECFQVESSNYNIDVLGEAQLADTQSEPKRDDNLIVLEEVKAGLKSIEDGDLSISPDENKEELDANVTENFIQENLNSESLENPQIEVIREEANTECFQVESSNSNIGILGEAQLADTQSEPKRDETLIILEEVKVGLKNIEDGDLSISPDENKEDLHAFQQKKTENFIQKNINSESLENPQIETIREEASTVVFQVASSNSIIDSLGEVQPSDTQTEPKEDGTVVSHPDICCEEKQVQQTDTSDFGVSPNEELLAPQQNETEAFIQENTNPQSEIIREDVSTECLEVENSNIDNFEVQLTDTKIEPEKDTAVVRHNPDICFEKISAQHTEIHDLGLYLGSKSEELQLLAIQPNVTKEFIEENGQQTEIIRQEASTECLQVENSCSSTDCQIQSHDDLTNKGQTNSEILLDESEYTSTFQASQSSIHVTTPKVKEEIIIEGANIGFKNVSLVEDISHTEVQVLITQRNAENENETVTMPSLNNFEVDTKQMTFLEGTKPEDCNDNQVSKFQISDVVCPIDPKSREISDQTDLKQNETIPNSVTPPLQLAETPDSNTNSHEIIETVTELNNNTAQIADDLKKNDISEVDLLESTSSTSTESQAESQSLQVGTANENKKSKIPYDNLNIDGQASIDSLNSLIEDLEPINSQIQNSVESQDEFLYKFNAYAKPMNSNDKTDSVFEQRESEEEAYINQVNQLPETPKSLSETSEREDINEEANCTRRKRKCESAEKRYSKRSISVKQDEHRIQTEPTGSKCNAINPRKRNRDKLSLDASINERSCKEPESTSNKGPTLSKPSRIYNLRKKRRLKASSSNPSTSSSEPDRLEEREKKVSELFMFFSSICPDSDDDQENEVAAFYESVAHPPPGVSPSEMFIAGANKRKELENLIRLKKRRRLDPRGDRD